jgi:hypothetical protein
MAMNLGVVNDAPALIDLDRNEFAPFPFGHELMYDAGRPTGFQTATERATQSLNQLAWQTIPFSARVREHYRRRRTV